MPIKKEGFLATNSIIAFSISLTRAYSEAQGLYFDCDKYYQVLKHSKNDYENIKNLDTLFFLYGGWGLPVAQDAESKFSEAALANIQCIDYRNFAHGRHNWIAKRNTTTGIIPLITPAENEIAKKTQDLIPASIPRVAISTIYDGPLGTIDLLIKLFQFVNIFSKNMGVDPSKPSVPYFGRRLYHLHYEFKGEKRKPYSERDLN